MTKGAHYQYDGEGNLIKKIEAPDPDVWVYGKKGERVYSPSPVWKYEYYGNGMLKKVIKPDGEEVSFRYDSLGRRIEKSSNSKIVKFVWDGNNPLHEWEENVEKPRFNRDSLVTWIFKDNFVPSAKLTNQGSYSIISDHLGTPVEAYDIDGKKVWEQDLDIYGRVRKRSTRNVYGAKIDDDMKPDNFIPFKYQGQYSDEETGLYYNRFRYYDPQLGQYITQDPIGLAGGNPTLYGYVHDPNTWIDPFGLARWKPGDSITAPIGPTSRPPSWSTVRRRYWRNVNHDSGLPTVSNTNRNDLGLGNMELSESQLERAGTGRAPLDSNGNPLELHHVDQRQDGGTDTLDNLAPVTNQEHAQVDEDRRLGDSEDSESTNSCVSR